MGQNTQGWCRKKKLNWKGKVVEYVKSTEKSQGFLANAGRREEKKRRDREALKA